MVGISTIVLVGVGILLGRYLYQLLRNSFTARRLGLPYVTCPIDQNNFVWMVVSVVCRPWMKRHLPAFIWTRLRHTIYGWEFQEKLKPFHASIDPKSGNGDRSFLLNGCGRLELWTGSSTITQQILSRPGDFQQPDIIETFVGIFGKNVIWANGKEWTKHRKIVASAITERISPVVWAISATQANTVVNEICETTNGESGETINFFDMLKTITIQVLSEAGMGVKKEWTSKRPKENNDGNVENEISYMDSVKLLNEYMSGPTILPTKLLLNWPSFMPGYKNLRQLGQAKVLYPVRTKEMLVAEKQRLAAKGNDPSATKSNVLSMLVAASDTWTDETDEKKSMTSTHKASALTNDELASNLYIFTSAGYDTTANTLAYAMVLLMRYPRWQDWLFQEIDSLIDAGVGRGVDGAANYQAIFPKCTRILAFMFETLRLFPPLIHMTKETKESVKLTTDAGKDLILPPFTTIYVDNIALHLDHRVWRDINFAAGDSQLGDDAAPGRDGATNADYALGGGSLGDEWRFRPTRWIVISGRQESHFQPPKGSFTPWSMGPRVCPGQRMAQVEFTSILFTMLSKYRLEAVTNHSEGVEALNKRLDMLMQGSISKLALEMDVFNKHDDVRSSSGGKGEDGLKVRLIKRRA